MNPQQLAAEIETRFTNYLVTNKSINGINTLVCITLQNDNLYYHVKAKRTEQETLNWKAIEFNDIAQLNALQLAFAKSMFGSKVKSYFKNNNIASGNIKIQNINGKNQYNLYKKTQEKDELIKEFKLQEIL